MTANFAIVGDYRLSHILIIFLLLFTASPLLAEIQVEDDTGQQIVLQQPARKVISLSPGLTELIYAAGGAEYIIAAVSYSDYPKEAKELPHVGSYNALDMEQILIMQPDLIVAWQSGNPAHQIEKLKKMGLEVYISEPKNFLDIPRTIKSLGSLMASEATAIHNADSFVKQLELLKHRYPQNSTDDKKRTFIQIWDNPIMTINKKHLISQVISFCGGTNVFAHSKGLTSSLTAEAVLQQDPQIIIATGMADTSRTWLQRWRQWPFINAVKNQRLYATNPDHLVRHTPRILQGINDVCQLIHNRASYLR